HVATGMANPILRRRKISAGTKPRIASFRISLELDPFIFRRDGIEAAYSTTAWSSNGQRTSSEFAILARSTLARMSAGRQVLKSMYWTRDRGSAAGGRR